MTNTVHYNVYLLNFSDISKSVNPFLTVSTLSLYIHSSSFTSTSSLTVSSMKISLFLFITFELYANACQHSRVFHLLDCSRRGLPDFKPKDVTDYVWVRVLDLRFNNLTTIDVAGLKMKMPNLERIDVRGNAFLDCEMVNQDFTQPGRDLLRTNRLKN